MVALVDSSHLKVVSLASGEPLIKVAFSSLSAEKEESGEKGGEEEREEEDESTSSLTVTHACLSLDGSLIALASEGEGDGSTGAVYLLDAGAGKLLGRVEVADDTVLSLAFSPEGKELAFSTSGGEGGAKLSVQRVGTAGLEAHPHNEKVTSGDWIRCVCWDAAGERLACGDDEGHVKVGSTSFPKLSLICTYKGCIAIFASTGILCTFHTYIYGYILYMSVFGYGLCMHAIPSTGKFCTWHTSSMPADER